MKNIEKWAKIMLIWLMIFTIFSYWKGLYSEKYLYVCRVRLNDAKFLLLQVPMEGYADCGGENVHIYALKIAR